MEILFSLLKVWKILVCRHFTVHFLVVYCVKSLSTFEDRFLRVVIIVTKAAPPKLSITIESDSFPYVNNQKCSSQ